MFHKRLFLLGNTSSTMGIDLLWKSFPTRIIQSYPVLGLGASMLRWTYWILPFFRNRSWCIWLESILQKMIKNLDFGDPSLTFLDNLLFHELGDRHEKRPLFWQDCSAFVSNSFLHARCYDHLGASPAAVSGCFPNYLAAAHSRHFWELFLKLALV